MIITLLIGFGIDAQTATLPIDFEGGSIFNGDFTVTVDLKYSQDLEIEIRDILGRVLESEMIFGAKESILKTYSIENYSSGMHSVLIRTTEKTTSLKLVKP